MREEIYILCQGCEGEIKFDLMLSDELWKKITPDKVKYLCPLCIMKRLEKENSKYVYELLEIWRPNLKWNPESNGDPSEIHKCDVIHELVYYRGDRCPVCKLNGAYNELRYMYFQEYSKNERWGK